MVFTKDKEISFLTCERCGASGVFHWRKCPECSGFQFTRGTRGKILYWKYPLTRDFLSLEKARHILNGARAIFVLLLGLNSFIWFVFLSVRSGFFKDLIEYPQIWAIILEGLAPSIVFLFWLGAASFLYLYYMAAKRKEFRGEVESFDYDNVRGGDFALKDWEQVKKYPRSEKLNIAHTFTKEALAAVGSAYESADKERVDLDPLHLFEAALRSNRASNIFIRLGVSAETIKKKTDEKLSLKKESKKGGKSPIVGLDFQKTLLLSYESAYFSHQNFVSVVELLTACAEVSEEVRDILFGFDIDKRKLANVIEWARIREKLRRNYELLRHKSWLRSKKGMDRAMTATATPYLNRFGEDLTLLAQLGYLALCVAREKETEEMFRVIKSGRQNVLLVGETGVGKRAIVEGIAQRMVEEDVPESLHDKRLIRLSVSALLSGATASQAVERLSRIMNEARRAGNVILFIHNLHELVDVSAGGESSLDVAGSLAEFLGETGVLVLADTTNEYYGKSVRGSSLEDVFEAVNVEEMGVDQAIQVLESKVGLTEHKEKVFFSYHALEKAVSLSKKFIHTDRLPSSALEVMAESATLARKKKGLNSLVTADEVSEVVSDKSRVPLAAVSSDESNKLLRLEQLMHERLISQDEATASVANALRRARADLSGGEKTIANFLFLGPTGVGKTELAKTVAEVYFGGQERMIRLDMSEYQTKSSIYRLIGQAGQKGGGILTEAVRQNPFALLLLDEIEKADSDVLNLFLQVMDDGRLTDSVGGTVDFTNVILVATSNAGSDYLQSRLREGVSSEVIKEKMLHGELREYFRPEFLNRFDGVILFKALTREEIRQVAALMLKKIAINLAEKKGLILEVRDGALDYLAEIGYDPEFGARPMRRAIQDKIESKIAELILGGKLNRKDKIIIDGRGEVTVER